MDISLINVPASAKVDLIKWAEIVIEKWEFNLANRNLVHTGDLINSFSAHVSAESANNTALISFAFEYYLRMLDMGVGKDVPYGEWRNLRESRRVYGTQKGNRRKPIPVYSRTLYAQIMKLGELLTKQYATAGAKMIIDEFMHGEEGSTTYNVDNMRQVKKSTGGIWTSRDVR